MEDDILVIDDEQSIRQLFSRVFKTRGYNVSTAASGHEALKLLETHTYRLIFLDLNMPDMSGIDTLRKIRKTDDTASVYIITAFEQAYFEELMRVREDNIEFELLQKPISKNKLLMVADNLLGK